MLKLQSVISLETLGVHLSFPFLFSLNFQTADLTNANLEGANLEGANLKVDLHQSSCYVHLSKLLLLEMHSMSGLHHPK